MAAGNRGSLGRVLLLEVDSWGLCFRHDEVDAGCKVIGTGGLEVDVLFLDGSFDTVEMVNEITSEDVLLCLSCLLK